MKTVAIGLCSLLLSTTTTAVLAAKRSSLPPAQKPVRDASFDTRKPKPAPLPAPPPSNHYADHSGQPWTL